MIKNNHIKNDMVRLIIIIVVSFLFVPLYGQDLQTVKGLYLLDKIITYCLNDSQKIFSTVKFYYDSDYKRIRKYQISKDGAEYHYLYKYDALGNLKSEEFYVIRDSSVLENICEFNYNSFNKLISKENYSIISGKKILNDRTGYDTITTIEKNLIKKCIDNQILLFDNSGKLVEKRSKNDPLVIKYRYRDLLLISESYYIDKNQLTKRHLYFYDNDNNMIKKYTEIYGKLRGKGKNVKLGNYQQEENKYKNGRITEKRTIDQGFDPCGSYCCGNFIIKYEYIEQ